MEISITLFVFSCFVSNYLIHFVTSDPRFGQTRGWSSNVDGADSNPAQSPAANQLPLWAINSTFYDGPNRATNLHGVPVPSLTASQAIGTRGHVLLQDFTLIEKLASFNRERVPERTVHAKGAGAHGWFTVTHDISQYTKAKFLNGIGKKTRIFVRFSTVGGELGSADTAVDPNGFAIKFYTEDGNHDLVGNNIETFTVRDPMLFVDFVRTRKRNPQTHLKDQNMWWDFVSLRPESTLNTLHLFSDIGRSDGYRKMDGFGIHAFKCVNEHNEVVFCKFVWRTDQPGPAQTYQQALELTGTNPEYKTQDLYDAIARGDFPSWTMYLQVMTLEQAKKYPRNPFDITRTWREEEFPMIPVGRLILNRNPINHFAEVEQAAFAVHNMVPGIEPSPDRILAARLFSYQDALRYRLGTNFAHIPINRPEVEVNSYIRDGQACFGDNGGGSPNYFPNSYGGNVVDTEGASQISFHVEGIVDRFDIPEDEYVDARIFLDRDVDAEHRVRLVGSIANRLKDAKPEIRERALKNNFYPISTKFGDEIREAVQRLLEEQENSDKSNSKVITNKNRRVQI